MGKFLPFHRGHVELIEFAAAHCDELTVLVCTTEGESISGEERFGWIEEYYRSEPQIRPVRFEYDERLLPNTSVSSSEVSKKWAKHLTKKLPPFDYIFSSEKYGDYLAGYMQAKHLPFDPPKTKVPVSGTLIRQSPFRWWEFLPSNVKPHFVRKICLVGTESTGKSTLTRKLAAHFATAYVPETAREIIEKTVECRPEHLRQIAELHARTILERTKSADKLLFVDTDINITRSYSNFLFRQELQVEDWIERANSFDLYLYLKNDACFIQDGTRLVVAERDRLDKSHRQMFRRKDISLVEVGGTWAERFDFAVKTVNELFFNDEKH